MDELFEVEETQQLRREDAAALLRDLADQLERHNAVRLTRSGTPMTVKVGDTVEVELEVEVGTDETSLEIELTW